MRDSDVNIGQFPGAKKQLTAFKSIEQTKDNYAVSSLRREHHARVGLHRTWRGDV